MSAADVWSAVTMLAGGAAAAAAIGAVGLHAADVASGYELAAARRDAVSLRRTARQAEQRVSALRAPRAVLERAAALGLTTAYPSQLLCVHRDDIRFRLRVADLERDAFVRVDPRLPESR